MTVPVVLPSPIAKILCVAKLRAGAEARSTGALSLSKAVRPRKDAAGLKLNSEFIESIQTVCVERDLDILRGGGSYFGSLLIPPCALSPAVSDHLATLHW